MQKSSLFKLAALVVAVNFFVLHGYGCSMYKVTAYGKTLVGNNEDSWRTDPRIWFVPGENGNAGVGYVGYAAKNNPDGAMNEYGLVFDAFSMHYRPHIPPPDPQKADFNYSHLKTIMEQCKTVHDVYDYLQKLNLNVLNGSPLFNGGMLLFVDKTGEYLVVEAVKLTLGKDDKFALANFSIADTKDLKTITTERYRKGIQFMSNKLADTSMSYCTALSDTMSVNRKKAGDGTLYTTIYDLDKGLIHAYFFHDFSNKITFNLHTELSKGEHYYTFASLFPGNAKFEKYLSFITPENNRLVFFFILACGFLFFFTFLYFLISFLRSLRAKPDYLKLALAALALVLSFYTYVLLRNQGVYYFPSPYKEPGNTLVNLSSYIPFLLLLIIIPFLVINYRLIRTNQWNRFAGGLFALNNLFLLILMGLFAYWGFYVVI